MLQRKMADAQMFMNVKIENINIYISIYFAMYIFM